MAQGRRVERVGASIRKEVSELLINGIRDERVRKGMVTITSVEVSGDLQHCKIFISIFGATEIKEEVLAGLQAANGYVKGELGRRLNMRRAPELKFIEDKGIEKGSSILNLLGELQEERAAKAEDLSGIDTEDV